MVTDTRTLAAMARHGFIEWKPGIDRHWTGQKVKRLWVQPGHRLETWSDVFYYQNRGYRLHYVDGCFHPFVFLQNEQPPAFV